eukprot:CAMPEP_0197246986 /NCGR_PEP_ID=MMETSP1429-20130617/24934_1 /TAXON_ID=49237 /ORGANISM="Chaetoceros  sp., Strain UNC1202" /LENGTH=53 /DNA_ID=CAMNT_0042707787 /DNA_START=161 /DNA_END=322 /DNA_ORIENTATION=-
MAMEDAIKEEEFDVDLVDLVDLCAMMTLHAVAINVCPKPSFCKNSSRSTLTKS